MQKLCVVLSKFENLKPKKTAIRAADRRALMEFHIRNEIRKEYGLEGSLFSLTGNVILADMRQVRALTQKLNSRVDPVKNPEQFIQAGKLNAMGLIDEILHFLVAIYREQVQPDAFETAMIRLEEKLGAGKTRDLMENFCGKFPPRDVYAGKTDVPGYLAGSDSGESCQNLSLEELLLLAIANLNPAFRQFLFLFDDSPLAKETVYPVAIDELKAHLTELPVFGPDGMNLWDLLRAPALASPDSLFGQLEYMRRRWGLLLGKYSGRLLTGLDIINEEDKPYFFGPGPSQVLDFSAFENEYEKFSPDQEWMPRTVLIAKSTLVWLFQLSQKYGKEFTRLDQIPDAELDELARRGFTGLWLIGLWERSQASKTIKQWTGNPEAAASAYSLYDYDIASELGGWKALANLRSRCMLRGIRLGSDMVPNHTGIDSRWMIEHPDRFLQLPYPPFPTYNYNCGNLSGRDDITVQIEEHYFSRSDAAVVFKRIDNKTGETRFIYHGNDGTSMPWNDTAQIDFLNPEAREAVIRTIIGVCQQFSIVRFDAAMTLAKRHIQRLWFPAPGSGGAIASRAEHSITTEEFNQRIPNEFWREVVDRCAVEAPNTLLLAEAFWMMEGYFVRTLGMHRVYNSAFMNMLKNEENDKYRATIKNTMEFDPEILKRFVNFMNNPDEETAVAQFGKGDKYFGICTLLVTMPGLPMFGHGQIEGFEEKYGMEYRRSYRDEQADGYMVDRHEREIFPLMKRRYLFSGSSMFRIYDLYCGGTVNENVFAYSNRVWYNGREEKALIIYNNSYYETSGWIKMSDPAIQCEEGTRRDSLSEALAIHGENRYFTMLREQKSNLWFIRSSKAICENGFFAGLKGYETQVYLDIYEVEDDNNGRWARLNNDLKGKGVPDPLASIKDIFLGELYYRFIEIFNPELISNLCETSFKKSVVETLNKLVEKFVETAAHFITGADGAYDAWIPDTVAEDDEEDVSCNFTKIGNDVVLKEFASLVDRLAKIMEEIKKPGFPLSAFTNCKEKRHLLCSVILGYGVISLLRSVIGKEASGSHAASLAFTHWDLGRKLRDIFRSFGASENEVWKITDIARAVLIKTEHEPFWKKETKFDASVFAALILEENYLDDDFKRILGINIFDDVIWFNKEGFETALFYSSLFFMVEGSVYISIDERIKRITNVYDVLLKAEVKSGYRFDKLLENLTTKETKVKSGSKAAVKTGVKKVSEKPAVKTGTKKTSEKSDAKTVVKKTSEKPVVKTGVKKAIEKPVVKTGAKKTNGKAAVKAGVKKTNKKPDTKTVKNKKVDKGPKSGKKTAVKPKGKKK